MTTSTFGIPEDPYPVGTIIAWIEPLSEIPDGWAICDGNNGTPNLLNEFPRSVPDGTTDPGGTGGTNTVTLSSSQMPEHSHSSSVDNQGNHNHGVEGQSTGLDDSSSYPAPEGSSTYSDVTTNGSHSHSISIDNTGSGSSIDNRPEHVEVAFIQKL